LLVCAIIERIFFLIQRIAFHYSIWKECSRRHHFPKRHKEQGVSLGIVIKGPEGLVLAADSRVTLGAQTQQGQSLHVNFDNATKLLSFSRPHDHVGAVTYGQAAIGLRTAYSFAPEFEAKLPEKDRLTVEDYARRLSVFFMDQWKKGMPEDFGGPNMNFIVGGFDEGDPYGRAYLVEIPRKPEPEECNPHPGFGITWGGQREFVNRLVQGYDPQALDIVQKVLNIQPDQLQALREALASLSMPIPLQAMPLQDCVDLAIFFIRTTINAQNLTVGIRGVGGPIDVAIITRRAGLRFIQRKQILGEQGSSRQAQRQAKLENE
jgi:20S proteasome alpha/beta subunit